MSATSIESSLTRLALQVRPPVARIGLSNPPVNVIDITMMEELARVLEEVEARPDVSMILFTGEGKGFSGGVDVAAHTPEKIQEMLNMFHAVIRALVSSRTVTIAAVHGNCLGGGAELAMVCDIVITTEAANWGFPEIKLGCYPPVACTALGALIGQKRAAELILTGKSITGVEAASIGLANRAVQVESLVTAVEESVAQLFQLSPAALAVTKKAMYVWDAVHFDKGLARAEKIYLEEVMKTADAQEGIRAFMEKREPVWAGK
jgi:cyclohexa-1,5-dienecarbonyl-CoA hydratase